MIQVLCRVPNRRGHLLGIDGWEREGVGKNHTVPSIRFYECDVSQVTRGADFRSLPLYSNLNCTSVFFLINN